MSEQSFSETGLEYIKPDFSQNDQISQPKIQMKYHLFHRLHDPLLTKRYIEAGSKMPKSGKTKSGDTKQAVNTFSLSVHEAMNVSYPIPIRKSTKNYLELRHDQNVAWAQSRFDMGVALAKKALKSSSDDRVDLMRKAETCYKEGLDVIPNHIQTLTAYGALCANDERLDMARDLLKRAILRYEKIHNVFEDESCDNGAKKKMIEASFNDAKTYLSVVESKLHGLKPSKLHMGKSQVTLSNKAEKALHDAITEQTFLNGGDPKTLQTSTNSKYEILSSSSDELISVRAKKKETKKKRRKRHESSKKNRRRKKCSYISDPRKSKRKHVDKSRDEISDHSESQDSDSDNDYQSRRTSRKSKRK